MLKKKLLLGAAVAALGIIPVTAQADQVSVEMTAEWDNEVEVELEWELDVEKDLDIDGNIDITGDVDVEALAQATVDNKQILDRNEVQFEDYQNVFVPTDYQFEPNPGDTAQGAHPATYTNSASVDGDVAADLGGNVGINVAAGDYNLQDNAAALATADAHLEFVTEPDGTDPQIFSTLSGGAEAGNFALQSLFDNGFNNESADFENTIISNTATLSGSAATDAEGNIGINVVAGAFNIQKNALAAAVVNGGNLAEATAAVMQDAEFNDSIHEDVTNTASATGLTITSASGNIGINLAAGVGNMQVNSLTIAAALAPEGATPTPVTPTPTPAPTPTPVPLTTEP